MEKAKVIRVGIGVVIKDVKGQILLGRRNKDSKRGNTKFNNDWDWSLPGGGLEYGEDFEECAIRETKEETNLDIKDPVVFCVHDRKDDFAHWVTIGMLSTKWTGEPVPNEPDKHTEWKWFALDNLPENIFIPSMKTIEKLKTKKVIRKVRNGKKR